MPPRGTGRAVSHDCATRPFATAFPPKFPAAAGRGPTREPPAVRRARGETGTLRAARAFAPALLGCGSLRPAGGPHRAAHT